MIFCEQPKAGVPGETTLWDLRTRASESLSTDTCEGGVGMGKQGGGT